MSEPVIFDSCVLIDHFRTNCHAARLEALSGSIRHSSVVLAELERGAKTQQEQAFLAQFAQQHPILTPGEDEWLLSGRLLAALRKRHGFEPAKLRDLHFDTLIALTARTHGARLITSNRADFELIRKQVEFRLELW